MTDSVTESATTSAIQYMFDLHLERIQYQLAVAKAAPVLILDGYIGEGYTKLTNDFARIKDRSL